MKNIVVTRFSLRVANWGEKAYGTEDNRERWFEYRTNLLRYGLVESLKAQSVRPNYLFLFMDREDPSLFKKYFDWAEDWIRPIFKRPAHGGNDSICEFLLASDLSENALHDLVVSRIDSDDLLSSNYFESVNQTIDEAKSSNKPFEYVVAKNGFRTDFNIIQELSWLTPPFVNLYFDRYSGEDIYALNHTKLPLDQCLFSEEAKWMQIIHGSNVLNTFRKAGGSPIFQRKEPLRLTAETWPETFPEAGSEFQDLATIKAFSVNR